MLYFRLHCLCFSFPLAGLIIPVMDRVLGPYLRGGGAKAFNFQALSTDLLVRWQILFSTLHLTLKTSNVK